MGPKQPPIKMGTGYSLGVKLPCHGVTTHSTSLLFLE